MCFMQNRIETALFTVVLAVACCGAVALGNPIGLSPGSNGLSVGVWIGLSFVIPIAELCLGVWIGLFVAIPITIAAWSVLRAQQWQHRLVAPAVLMILFLGANAFGERLNQQSSRFYYTGLTVVVTYLTATVVFFVLRTILDWRIGPLEERPSTIRLQHLFLWIGIASFAFATIGWFANPEAVIGDNLFGAAWFHSVVSIVGSIVAALGIGLVLDDERRLVFGLALACVCTALAIVAFHFGRYLALVPFVFVVFTIWVFASYRSRGFELTRSKSERLGLSTRAKLSSAIGCVVLALFAAGSFYVHRDDRGDAALREKWRAYGVYPTGRNGDRVTAVLFRPGMELTLDAVACLEGEPVKDVAIWDYAPSKDAIRQVTKLESVRRIVLRGSKITDSHLRELYEANQLKEIVLRRVPSVTPNAIQRLREQLPDCTISMP